MVEFPADCFDQLMVKSDFGLGVERGNRTRMTLIFMIFMIFFGVLGGDSDSASFPVKSVF